MKIIELECVDSTNEYCKRSDNGEDIIVTAKKQSAGKGTKGRSFSSAEGGLYVSVMRHYKNFRALNAFCIMVNTSVAVCKTLELFGIKPQIKWANDVLVNGKKICGTLIENIFSGEYISRSVVGCGINVNNELPAELENIATTMKLSAGKDFSVKEVKRAFVLNVQKEFSIEDYKGYMGWLGNTVTLKTESGERKVVATDISEDGRLIVEDNGKTELISSAEVSLRL